MPLDGPWPPLFVGCLWFFPVQEERELFKDYMEDYNTATFPSKKYYNLEVFEAKQRLKRVRSLLASGVVLDPYFSFFLSSRCSSLLGRVFLVNLLLLLDLAGPAWPVLL